jgi:hypothetical protein
VVAAPAVKHIFRAIKARGCMPQEQRHGLGVSQAVPSEKSRPTPGLTKCKGGLDAKAGTSQLSCPHRRILCCIGYVHVCGWQLANPPWLA